MNFKRWYLIIFEIMVTVITFGIIGIYIYYSLIEQQKIEWEFITIMSVMWIISIYAFLFFYRCIITVEINVDIIEIELLNKRKVTFSANDISNVICRLNSSKVVLTNGKKYYAHDGVQNIQKYHNGKFYRDLSFMLAVKEHAIKKQL